MNRPRKAQRHPRAWQCVPLCALWFIFVCMALVATAAAQKPSDTTDTQAEIERAQAFLNNGDPNAAIYLLKQTLEKRHSAKAARMIADYYDGIGDYQQAVQYIKSAVLLAPGDTDARVNYARLLSWTGDLKTALAEYQHVLAGNPQHEEALLGAARVLSWQKAYAQSIATYRKLLRLNPKRTDARVEVGRVLSWAGKLEPAASELEAVLRTEPRNVEARLALAHTRSWQGQLDDAIHEFDLVLSQRPKTPDAIIGKAQALMWKGDLASAKALLERLSTKEANSPDAITVRKAIAKAEQDRVPGQTTAAVQQPAAAPPAATGEQARLAAALDAAQQLGWAGKFPESITAYRKILGDHPDNPDAMAGLARVYSWSKRFDEAVALDRQLLAKTPGDLNLRLELAKILGWAGRYDESSQEYETVLKARPDWVEAELGRARVKAWQGKRDEAVEGFRAVLAQDPRNFDADLGIGQVYLWIGDLELAKSSLEALRKKYPPRPDLEPFARAVDELEQSVARAAAAAAAAAAAQTPAAAEAQVAELKTRISQNASDRDALRRLGDTYQASGDLKSAIATYERLVKIEPTQEGDRLTLAKYYSWNRQLNEAVAIYKPHMAAYPDDDTTRLELARVLSWTGRYEESEGEYQKLLARHDDREARLGYARVLSWDKKYPESLKQYAALRKSAPNDRELQMEEARVTSWAGKFGQAISLFDDVLAKTPNDREALVAKAQILTWSGRGAEAVKTLAPLREKEKRASDVGVVYASAQQQLGRPDLALATLDELNLVDPGNRDVRALRDSIRQSLRPELAFNFWSGLDSNQLHTFVTKMTYSFNTGPRVRSFFSVAVIPSSAPFAGQPNAQEFEYGLSLRANRLLQLRADAGFSRMSTSAKDFIGGFGFTVFPWRSLTVDFDMQRRAINGVPTAVPFDVSKFGPTLTVYYRPDSKTSFDITGYHWEMTDRNAQNGTRISLMRKLLGSERNSLALGYLFEYSGFTDEFYSGFFTPRRYQRHAAQLAYNGTIGKKFHYSFHGTLGKEFFATSTTEPRLLKFHRDGTATFGVSYDTSAHNSFGVSYSYLDLAIPGATGAFRTNAVSAFTRFRF